MCPLVIAIASLLCRQTVNSGAEQVVPNTANPQLQCIFAYPVRSYLPLLELGTYLLAHLGSPHLGTVWLVGVYTGAFTFSGVPFWYLLR